MVSNLCHLLCLQQMGQRDHLLCKSSISHLWLASNNLWKIEGRCTHDLLLMWYFIFDVILHVIFCWHHLPYHVIVCKTFSNRGEFFDCFSQDISYKEMKYIFKIHLKLLSSGISIHWEASSDILFHWEALSTQKQMLFPVFHEKLISSIDINSFRLARDFFKYINSILSPGCYVQSRTL